MSLPAEQPSKAEQLPPVVLFDGVCNLCHGTVRFVIERDTQSVFRFASLQSETGERIVAEHDGETGSLESMLLLEDGQLYRKSTAALRIAWHLRFPWSLAYGLVVLPPILRDLVYDFVGRRRYRWFGKRDYCAVSVADAEDRFLR